MKTLECDLLGMTYERILLTEKRHRFEGWYVDLDYSSPPIGPP